MVDVGKLYMTQISMTEWFEKINHAQTAALREEDNKKRERLKVINRLTGLPFDEPAQFEAADVANNTPAFQAYLKEHAGELLGLRLNPKDASLPKHRMRGKTAPELVAWFRSLTLPAQHYIADFIPHADAPLFSAIFVVNEHGFFGEIIKGGPHQLTQGFYTEHKPVTFAFDFKTWRIANPAPEYKKALQDLAHWLHMPDKTKQAALKKQLGATFAHNYLQGYFETITNTPDIGVWFVDYNRIMGGMFADAHMAKTTGSATLKGQPASRGTATGTVKIVLEKDVASATIKDGQVLVCDITTPDYVPLMQKAAAVVTDRGGILSHAAIVCRELGKPCVAATGNGTSVLKNGQKVTVNADAGTVTLQ